MAVPAGMTGRNAMLVCKVGAVIPGGFRFNMIGHSPCIERDAAVMSRPSGKTEKPYEDRSPYRTPCFVLNIM
jgi:hypothetical protein